jgi:hypothetical protein
MFLLLAYYLTEELFAASIFANISTKITPGPE